MPIVYLELQKVYIFSILVKVISNFYLDDRQWWCGLPTEMQMPPDVSLPMVSRVSASPGSVHSLMHILGGNGCWLKYLCHCPIHGESGLKCSSCLHPGPHMLIGWLRHMANEPTDKRSACLFLSPSAFPINKTNKYMFFRSN